jgi:hypothetical protein
MCLVTKNSHKVTAAQFEDQQVVVYVYVYVYRPRSRKAGNDVWERADIFSYFLTKYGNVLETT